MRFGKWMYALGGVIVGFMALPWVLRKVGK